MIMQTPTSGPIPCDRLIQPPYILSRSFNAAVHQIASRLFPRGFDVISEGPECLADLQSCYRLTRRIVVSSLHSDDTIFGDRETNYAFRAWHDWCHLTGGHEFDIAGEYAVSLMQSDHIRRAFGRSCETLWWPILDAEINAQAEYCARVGEFPRDQIDFDIRYMWRAHPGAARKLGVA